MNNRYYLELLRSKFSPEFVADFEDLCDKHNINDSAVVTKMYDTLQEEYDKEDVVNWLEIDSSYPSLAENDDFVDYLTFQYRRLFDCEYGTWDNIVSAFNYVKDMTEWKDIVDAAYNED